MSFEYGFLRSFVRHMGESLGSVLAGCIQSSKFWTQQLEKTAS
jgi:hypothetical protein